ncbi:hypothetical protein O3G_MSEX013378 [Manduca sexta]|uniref:PH domain-containing protein n=1 Tax=Manduca sexta TaxID=7130 RepID=A0A921ZR12_MANSE|nr:hypothetical protein O3G_MSEX013378 [Manduca sexta]
MSGYLEVKYPFRSNLGLNPFKSWKRQWCILRPSPTCSGGCLAVYCSEAGASAGSVELPSGCVVRRAKSRTRPHAFAVFTLEEPCKPRVLLAASSLHDAQLWMEKIRSLLSGNRILGTELLKGSYSVSVANTELSRRVGLSGVDGVVTPSAAGLLVAPAHKLPTYVEWRHVAEVVLVDVDNSKTCVVKVDREFPSGGGELRFTSPAAQELTTALKRAHTHTNTKAKKLSKSEGDLRTAKCSDEMGEVRRSSWYSGPSEVSLDDIELVMSKESKRIPNGQLSRYSGAGDLAPPATVTQPELVSPPTFDDSMSDRRSLLSVASGIYEEIPDLPDTASEPKTEALYCKMGRDVPDGIIKLKSLESKRLESVADAEGGEGEEEPMYESVYECVYATMRRNKRRPPPPLPPRLYGTLKSGCAGVTRHSSLCSLARAAPDDCKHRTLPRWDKSRQAFSVFRKRLKSDSRIASSPKSETSKENKDVETKKKKFDFTPTRDIFKSFKVSRKMKNLKITTGGLNKGETKSCEFLDETEHVTTNRCSKSVECLEGNDEFLNEYGADLSIEFNEDAVAALSLPQEIVDLLLGTEQLSRVQVEITLEYNNNFTIIIENIINNRFGVQ